MASLSIFIITVLGLFFLLQIDHNFKLAYILQKYHMNAFQHSFFVDNQGVIILGQPIPFFTTIQLCIVLEDTSSKMGSPIPSHFTITVGAGHFGTKFEEMLIKIGMKIEYYGKAHGN
jgi:hypothetical protein